MENKSENSDMAVSVSQKKVSVSGLSDNKIKEILLNNNIHDQVFEVIIKESGLKGESLASITYSVTIKFENGGPEPLELFAKRLPDDPVHRELVIESKQFIKEAMFFVEYLPKVHNFCKNLGQENLMNIYPKCYYGDDKLIVLENLVLNKGYTLLNKEDMQDFNAAKFALTNLAKHHAISHAYIKEMGGRKEFLKRFADLSFLSFDAKAMREMMMPFVEDPITFSIKILEKSSQEGKNEAIEILRKYQGKGFEIFMEPLRRKFEDDNEMILVLNHGDYWNSNMMFLKDNSNDGKFSGHVMIDFQVVNFSTPAIDVGYYLFSTVKPAVRQANFEVLLKLYLESFVKTTADLGHSVKMTYEDLLNDFRETFIHGFLLGLGFCTGIGLAVLTEADPSGVEMDEWASNYNKLVEKWTDDKPEKNEENAKILISVVEEHQNLFLA